jgi:uncharacterized Tic20 family protein
VFVFCLFGGVVVWIVVRSKFLKKRPGEVCNYDLVLAVGEFVATLARQD